MRRAYREDRLAETEPLAFDKTACTLYDTKEAGLKLPKRMNSKEELYAALKEARKTYAPFLENYAPKIPVFKTEIPITNFLLNDEEEITIPYYGGPLGNALQKYTTRFEMEDFFDSCDKIVRLNHPDCVIKHVDGDYDPPTENSMGDTHCYNLWYNGHEIDFGKMYRGYWTKTDPQWYYGCRRNGAGV